MARNTTRPEYIDFLLSPETPLDFHVNVGLPEFESERIGAVKWMLIARSKVLRTMLLESKLRKPNAKEFTVTDLEPETFKFFLTYIYGHDEIASLEFEDSIKLLNAAEKYDVKDLKTRIASIVIPRISVQNVSVVLKHGPVCDRFPLLWDTATEVIQFNIGTLVQLPQFLTLSPEAMVHILQQDALDIKELDLWKATLTWARHKLGFGTEGMPSAEEMRRTMGPLLRHTRLCTLQPAELCTEVVPSRILTPIEIDQICLSIGKREVVHGLTSICNKVNPRRGANLLARVGHVGAVEVSGDFNDQQKSKGSRCSLSTRFFSTLHIKSIEFAASSDAHSDECFIGVTISAGYQKSAGDYLIHKDFREFAGLGQPVVLEIDLKLDPCVKYLMRVQMRCLGHKHPAQWFPSAEQTLVDSSDHLRVIALPHGHSVYNHIKKINYKVIMPLLRGD